MSEIILFTGPHGAGKDSIEKRVRGERRDIRRIVRHITREPASGEQRDEDYHFVTRDQFRSLAAAGHFIEWVEYPDVLSGTAFGEIEGAASEKTFASLTLNLEDALEHLSKNEVLIEAFGEKIVTSYLKLKEQELKEFNSRETFSKKEPITDWEKTNTLDC